MKRRVLLFDILYPERSLRVFIVLCLRYCVKSSHQILVVNPVVGIPRVDSRVAGPTSVKYYIIRSMVIARLSHDCVVQGTTRIDKQKGLSSMGKALGAFWPGRDTGREPASCGGGRENSTALQDPCVFKQRQEGKQKRASEGRAVAA